MLDLDPAHGKVTRIPSSEHSSGGLSRRCDQAVRLRQCGPSGSELAPPFTSPPTFRSPDRHDAEAIEELLYRCGLRLTQAPDDFLDVDRGRA